MPTPPKRPVRFRALASLALTVILLAAAGVLLFLRFHHSPFKVSGVPTFSTAQNGCTVNVTGQIPTNGSSGTLSYQCVFNPQQGAPQPLSQSVVSGQHDVFVTVAVQGQGPRHRFGKGHPPDSRPQPKRVPRPVLKGPAADHISRRADLIANGRPIDMAEKTAPPIDMAEWTVPGYTTVRELGTGGFGNVVLARHDATGTLVAIKYLKSELLDDPGFSVMFRAARRKSWP